MPRACPVEDHGGSLHRSSQAASLDATGLSRGGSRWVATSIVSSSKSGCHGLGQWRLTLGRYIHRLKQQVWMPRACPVEDHAGSLHPSSQAASLDATGLFRGGSRWVAPSILSSSE